MKGLFKRLLVSFVPALMLAMIVFVSMGFAQLALPDAGNYDTAIGSNLISDKFKPDTNSTETQLEGIFKGEFVTAINMFIAALSIIWMGILAVKFISSQGEEEKIANYKKQFGFILLGLFIVSAAEYMAFNLLDPSDDILKDDQQGFIDGLYGRLNIFITFFKYIAGGIIIIIGGLAGFTMVTAGDQDEKRQAEVKFIKTFILGTMSIILAEVTVRVLSLRDPAKDVTYTPDEAIPIGIIQIVGLTKFVLSFFGGAAFLMLVLSALYFIISLGKEEQAARAKRMLIYSLVALIIASSSFALVNYVASNYSLGS